MAFDTRHTQASDILAQESAGIFMAQVYRWMVVGLGLSAGTAWYVSQSAALIGAVRSLSIFLFIAQLVVVFSFSAMASRLSRSMAVAFYLGYAFLSGLTFSGIFLRYHLPSISSAFVVSAGMFAALSLYGTVTKRDLSGWATFLFMGLVGIVLASLVNLFVGSGMMSFVITCSSVVVFAGLTAYDTQKLREVHVSSGYASQGSLAIHGALILYLDFINLFLAILRLLGNRR